MTRRAPVQYARGPARGALAAGYAVHAVGQHVLVPEAPHPLRIAIGEFLGADLSVIVLEAAVRQRGRVAFVRPTGVEPPRTAK